MEGKQLHSIVSRSIAGDRNAQKMLYNTLAPMMLSVAHRYANHKADAEDIFQESVLNIFKRLEQLRETEKIFGWAKKVVVHEAIRFYKKQRNLVFGDETPALKSIPERDSDIYKKIETDELLRMIQQLPDKMRMVINLYAIEGYSHEEIAEMLGISVGTSKSNLHDARKRIKKLLSGEAKKKDEQRKQTY